MHVKVLDDRSRAEDLLDHALVLDDPVMAPAGFDRNDHVLGRCPRNVRRAIEEPDRLEDLEVGQPKRKLAIEGASDYVVLDWIRPSLISESMQARISA